MTKEQKNNRRLLSLDDLFMDEEPEKEKDEEILPPTEDGLKKETENTAKRGARNLRRYIHTHVSEETKEKLEQAQRAERSAREEEKLNREAPIPDVLHTDVFDEKDRFGEPDMAEDINEEATPTSVITVPQDDALLTTPEEGASYEEDAEDLTVVIPRVDEEALDREQTQVFTAVRSEDVRQEDDEVLTVADEDEDTLWEERDEDDLQDTAEQKKAWPFAEEPQREPESAPAYADEVAEEKKPEAKGLRGVFFNWILPISVALLLAIVIRFFIGGATTVSGTSMEPTLHNGDFLLVSKIPTYFKNYKRGDILIIDSPDLNEFYVKRLIGLPGETVEIQDGKVFINGKWMKEYYTDQETVSYSNAKWTLGNNEYFVLGDNRGTGASNDSRLFGPVLAEHIKAVSRARIWPITKMMLMY